MVNAGDYERENTTTEAKLATMFCEGCDALNYHDVKTERFDGAPAAVTTTTCRGCGHAERKLARLTRAWFSENVSHTWTRPRPTMR